MKIEDLPIADGMDALEKGLIEAFIERPVSLRWLVATIVVVSSVAVAFTYYMLPR